MAVEAFNLLEHHITWVKTQPKGQRSAMVRRALDFWMRSGQVMESRDELQDIVLAQDLEIQELRRRQVGGKRLFLAFLLGYILSHALYLLEY